MAEKRSTAEDDHTAVPPVPAAAPDQADPPRQRGPSRSTAADNGGSPPEPAPSARPAKGANHRKQAKAAEPAGAGTGARKAARNTKPARSTKTATPAKSAGASKRTDATKATKAAKATKATKTAKAAEATEANEATEVAEVTEVPGPAAGPPAPAGPAVPGAWLAAGSEALRQPDQPPHRVAELAVAELGPRAAAWTGWLRATYPGAPAYGIARLAAREAHRAAWGLAATEAAGPVAAVLGLPAAAWVRVSLVLRIAAAYGHDPADPRRAGELLELLGLAHPGRAGVTGRLGLTRLAARRFGLRRTLAATALRALTAASDHHERIDRLAHRAARYYRRPGQRQPSSESTSSRNSA